MRHKQTVKYKEFADLLKHSPDDEDLEELFTLFVRVRNWTTNYTVL